jgi:hypothetical protein
MLRSTQRRAAGGQRVAEVGVFATLGSLRKLGPTDRFDAVYLGGVRRWPLYRDDARGGTR